MNVKMECPQGTTPVIVEGLLKFNFCKFMYFKEKGILNFAKTGVLHVATEN